MFEGNISLLYIATEMGVGSSVNADSDPGHETVHTSLSQSLSNDERNSQIENGHKGCNSPDDVEDSSDSEFVPSVSQGTGFQHSFNITNSLQT